MFTRIRNALARGKGKVEIPYSVQKEAISKVLQSEKFVKSVGVFKEKGSVKKGLVVELLYGEDGKPAITSLTRVSKPGLRVYEAAKEIKPVLGGLGVYIISTSRGIMSSLNAKKKKLGGEVICKVH